VGEYPYTELDLVDAPEAFGGLEYPGLVYIGTVGTSWLIEPTVHEVAHQWFYALIGNDQLVEPWLDEAIATYSEIIYYEELGYIGMATSLLDSWRAQLRNHPRNTTPIGLTVGEYESQWDYSLFVYLKGALFLEELRLQFGDDVFFEFMRAYFDGYRYGFSSGLDFQRYAEQACDCDLEPLFDLWVYEGGEIFIP
jgi:aminopeptidase N